MKDVRFSCCGDSAISVEFENEISDEVNSKVKKFCMALEAVRVAGIEEIVPSYRAALVYYNPGIILYQQAVMALQSALQAAEAMEPPPPSVIEIPVTYGGEYGPDLSLVASYHGISESEVIKLHTEREYLIYMLGFTPGFPYLGGVNEKIVTPRLEKPRTIVPVGSVGIAGTQTGIYTVESPGGWQIIGRTPLKLYDCRTEERMLLKGRQYIKFKAVDVEEYIHIQQSVRDNCYKHTIYVKEK